MPSLKTLSGPLKAVQENDGKNPKELNKSTTVAVAVVKLKEGGKKGNTSRGKKRGGAAPSSKSPSRPEKLLLKTSSFRKVAPSGGGIRTPGVLGGSSPRLVAN
jgi:hypothetical protein